MLSIDFWAVQLVSTVVTLFNGNTSVVFILILSINIDNSYTALTIEFHSRGCCYSCLVLLHGTAGLQDAHLVAIGNGTTGCTASEKGNGNEEWKRSLDKEFTMRVAALPSVPTFCATGTSLWSDQNHRNRVWGSAMAPSPDHPVACSSACWRADSPIGCDAMSSCQWHDQSHRIQAWDT